MMSALAFCSIAGVRFRADGVLLLMEYCAGGDNTPTVWQDH
jgi:hypothetical protein